MRRAGADDAGALALVASATFLDTFAGIIPGRDIVAHCAAKNTVAAFGGWVADPGSAALIATTPIGGPLGYALLTAPDLPVAAGPADIELKRIYALSRTHGSGLGRALMEAALTAAREMGRQRMLLGTAPWNARARAFYERHGFVLIGERRFQVGSTMFEDVVYAREL